MEELDRHQFVMRLLSEPRYLCAVRATVETLARQLGLGREEAGRVVMAVDEAVTNVIRHGYKCEPGQPIWLRVNPLGDHGREGLEIVIEDECEQVDPSSIAGRPLEEVRPGGLGVHIIRQAMDEVRFDRRSGGRGMRVTMRKYISSGDAQQGDGVGGLRTGSPRSGDGAKEKRR